MSEMYGPAWVDLINGVIHISEDCANQHATAIGVAGEGQIEGCDWCPVCAPPEARPKPSGETHE